MGFVPVLFIYLYDLSYTREEAFGPVAPLLRFKTEEDAIRIANDTNAGNSCSSTFQFCSTLFSLEKRFPPLGYCYFVLMILPCLASLCLIFSKFFNHGTIHVYMKVWVHTYLQTVSNDHGVLLRLLNMDLWALMKE